jgi:hypothetical protein
VLLKLAMYLDDQKYHNTNIVFEAVEWTFRSQFLPK